MNIVFTGGATYKGGRVIRDELIAAVTAQGHSVQSMVSTNTDILVASRDDTRKARKAQALGVKVLTYPGFIRHHLGGVHV